MLHPWGSTSLVKRIMQVRLLSSAPMANTKFNTVTFTSVTRTKTDGQWYTHCDEHLYQCKAEDIEQAKWYQQYPWHFCQKCWEGHWYGEDSHTPREKRKPHSRETATRRRRGNSPLSNLGTQLGFRSKRNRPKHHRPKASWRNNNNV